MGPAGATFIEHVSRLEETYGIDASRALVDLMVAPSTEQLAALMLVAPDFGEQVKASSGHFGEVRAELDRVVEEQLEQADVPEIARRSTRASRACYQSARATACSRATSMLWASLADPRYYPLLDEGLADLVRAAIREGAFDPSASTRSRSGQVGAASDFPSRLPTFPLATMDEIVGIRNELSRPLVRFRSALSSIAREFDVDALSGDYRGSIETAWVERVHPALLQLEDLVEEKRLQLSSNERSLEEGSSEQPAHWVAGLNLPRTPRGKRCRRSHCDCCNRAWAARRAGAARAGDPAPPLLPPPPHERDGRQVVTVALHLRASSPSIVTLVTVNHTAAARRPTMRRRCGVRTV
jgi:hypothetical protein